MLFVNPNLPGLELAGMKIRLMSTISMLILFNQANTGILTSSKTFTAKTNCFAAWIVLTGKLLFHVFAAVFR